MTINMLTENSGALRGLDTSSIASTAYGGSARYMEADYWEGYVGAIVRPGVGRPQGEMDVIDYVIEVHDV